MDRPLDWLTLLRYYYGNLIWLLPLVAFAPFLWRSRRTRFAAILTAVIAAVSVTEVWWYPHYGAPFMAALLILAAQSMRYLRQWKQDGREVGRFLVSAMPVAVLLVMVASETEAIVTHRTADQIQARNLQKESAEQELLGKNPGQHVIFVRYAGPPVHTKNGFIIRRISTPLRSSGRSIWARARTSGSAGHYAGRSFWLFKPGESTMISPY